MPSILDNDLYKFTMQQAVLNLYPDAYAEYKFINRGRHDITPYIREIRNAVETMDNLRLSNFDRMRLFSLGLFSDHYLEYLMNYRYYPSEVNISEDGIDIKGLWHRTILWEVPLLAIITSLCSPTPLNMDGFIQKTRQKAEKLSKAGCTFADFGTRRRRCLEAQKIVVSIMNEYDGFVGTSNVIEALRHHIKPIGTMAHEWVMGVSALESLRYANRFALRKWMEVYQGDLGIALTDTFTTKPFWRDFDLLLAKTYDGVRHDSGCPFKFGRDAIDFYDDLGIDPKSKTIIFSDGLDVDKALEIHERFKDEIKISFGIGTHFTNDFEDPPMNIVIKLSKINHIDVVKLSDVCGKETGNQAAIDVAKWTFGLTGETNED